MKRIILAAITLSLLGGVASADRGGWRRGRDTSQHSGGTVVRDHRGSYREPVRTYDRGSYRNYNNNYRQRVRYERRPIYNTNGRFVFNGGVTRVYNRPVFRTRYTDYRYRPQVIIQNYDPVPGYIWVQGNWNWSGYEWVWSDGYWAVDTNYSDDAYYDSYNGGVDVNISGGVRF